MLSLFYEKSLEFFYEKSFDSTVKRASTFLQEVFRQFYEKNLHEIIDCSRPREDLLCGSKRRPLAPGLWSFEGRSDGHLRELSFGITREDFLVPGSTRRPCALGL